MRPTVGVVYSAGSALSREEAQLARYVALCVAASGRSAKTWLVGVPSSDKIQETKEETDVLALRCDGALLDGAKLGTALFEETRDVKKLDACDLWLLVVEADATLRVAELLRKKLGKQPQEDAQPKRVVLSLQTTMRRLAQLNSALPDAIVLHGGAAFQVVKDEKGVLRPLSSGCFFVERLSKEKASALYALDVLEGTGIQVLSRRNIQALKWGCTMLRSFYYINALTGRSVLDGLRDRKRVSCFYRRCKDTAVVTSDLQATPPLQTNFETEFRDIFELASGRNMALPALEMLQKTLLSAKKQQLQELKDGVSARTPLRIDSGVLLAGVKLSPNCTAASRTFFLKVFVTFALTLLLGLYLFVW
ncbi:NAD(P)-binding domain [Phytophthora cinnamomi]|uniref:NAD(P)-binding domain n=1 Tax=Phytophthora cinnamomi TaxID=4785 RepID=UPI00355A016E|nr:NAD(P)-binding domain [Phytophthora cinnamomi]